MKINQLKCSSCAVIIGMLANMFTMGGIILGFCYYKKGLVSEKRRIAIEALNQVKSKEVIDALRRLENGDNHGRLDYPTALSDMDYVIAWYDYIGMLYLNNIADRCLIKKEIFKSTNKVARILNNMKYPSKTRENFDLFRQTMKDNKRCAT